MTKSIEKELRSFVTFALAVKPKVTLHRKPDSRGPEISLSFSVKNTKVKPRFHGEDALIEKYRQLKPYLDVMVNSGESIADCAPTINFQPNVKYQTVKLTEGEFEIARQSALHLGEIERARAAKDKAGAAKHFERFDAFIRSKRDELLGAFGDLAIANPVASFGAGRVSDDGDCTGQVIFVIAEVIIVCPMTEDVGVVELQQ